MTVKVGRPQNRCVNRSCGASLVEGLALILLIALGAMVGMASFGTTVKGQVCKPSALVGGLDPGAASQSQQTIAVAQSIIWDEDLVCCAIPGEDDGWGEPLPNRCLTR